MTGLEQTIARIMEIDLQRQRLEGELSELMEERSGLEAAALEAILASHPDGHWSMAFNGRKASVSDMVVPKYKQGKTNADVAQALKDIGHGEMVKESVHAMTWGAFFRELLEQGPLPPQLDELVEADHVIRIKTARDTTKAARAAA